MTEPMNIFLEEEYIRATVKALCSGKVSKIAIGRLTYEAIQENPEVKAIYEKLLEQHSLFSIRFNPEIPQNTEEIIGDEKYIWERDRETGHGYIQSAIQKGAAKKQKNQRYFDEGISIKDFNAPLKDLMAKFLSSKG